MTLNGYLENLKKNYPAEIVTIEDEVNPDNFEVTAILRHLELAGKHPLLYFTRPLNLKGEVSRFPLATNVFACRERCALALDLGPEQCKLPLALRYGQREASPLPTKIIAESEAPVKEVVKVNEEVDLREFPIVKHHEMDLGPYIDMTPIMCDPQSGAYNAAFLRTRYKDPRQLGLYMSPRHNWEIVIWW